MELVTFWITAAVAVVGAVAMLVTRNAVHSALFLLLNFLAIAILFLMLLAPFLFAIQLTVYAGAIMVLFLFVVMLLGAERVEDSTDKLAWQLWLALGLSGVLLVQAVVVGFLSRGTPQASADAAAVAAVSTPTAIGESLFTTYLLPFEITGILLLVAIVGVVVLQTRSQAHGGAFDVVTEDTIMSERSSDTVVSVPDSQHTPEEEGAEAVSSR